MFIYFYYYILLSRNKVGVKSFNIFSAYLKSPFIFWSKTRPKKIHKTALLKFINLRIYTSVTKLSSFFQNYTQYETGKKGFFS